MKQTVTFYTFKEAFQEKRPQNFTFDGLWELWKYLAEFEESSGRELELDVVGLCIDFQEESWKSIASNYSIDLDDAEDDDEKYEAVKAYLEIKGALVGEVAGGSFVYRDH